MVDAARQVATLALLCSHHADGTHFAVDALQQEEQERRQHRQTQRRRRRQTRQRSCWVRDWLSHRQRLLHSHYYNLMESLRQRDPDSFKNFTRVEPAFFDELLDRLRLRITKKNTSCRDAIEPGLKLAVTLRHLATGNSYVDLGYSFRVGGNSICLFLPEVCQAIMDEFLDDAVPTPMTKDEWKTIAEEFLMRWNVPHACGALDGKHVAIKKPPHSGSEYFNYKGFFSIVLLALVDANYRFLWADVGGVGSQSDAQIYNGSELAEVLQSGEINLPDDDHLPNDDRPHPYFMLSDGAFALKSYMMKPYSRRNMTYEEKLANYRISRGRRVVENAFGIMALRWQVLLTTMQQTTETVQLIVKTCMVLHNMMRTRYPDHHQALVDHEDGNGNLIPGNWRRNVNMHDMQQARGPTRESTKAKQEREYLKLYFNSPAGSVPWQDNMV